MTLKPGSTQKVLSLLQMQTLGETESVVEPSTPTEQIVELPIADNPEKKVQFAIRLTPKKESDEQALHPDTVLAQEIQIGQEFFAIEMGRTRTIA
jgi:hypothetical protein